MAVYKVPQDVEADDKLIGPFSFRQFIYLIVVAISMAIAWGLSQLFIPLAIIPLPVIVFFAALALPLRKDQPMEAYLSAVVSFYFLKSRKRFWQPDGIDSFVTIIPPKDSDRILTKGFDETEASRRLQYLAQLVDSHGWAIRGASATPDTSINTDLYYETQATPDMMDATTDSAKAMKKQLADEANHQKQAAIQNMQTASRQTPSAPVANAAQSATNPGQPASSTVEPVSTLPSIDEALARQEKAAREAAEKKQRDAIAYANALAEEAAEGQGKPVAKTPPSTSVSTPDTGTMELTREQADELSKQTDVSVQTLAQEANHVAKKNKELKNGDEVTISLR